MYIWFVDENAPWQNEARDGLRSTLSRSLNFSVYLSLSLSLSFILSRMHTIYHCICHKTTNLNIEDIVTTGLRPKRKVFSVHSHLETMGKALKKPWFFNEIE